VQKNYLIKLNKNKNKKYLLKVQEKKLKITSLVKELCLENELKSIKNNVIFY
jgi:hypothetical protein